MAKYGAKNPVFAPITAEAADAAPTYGNGISLGKLVKADVTVNMSSGELYADDALAEKAEEFTSGTVDMETDDMTDTVASAVYGASVNDSELVDTTADAAPMGGLGYYVSLMRSGVKKYKGYFFPKVKAALGSDAAQTKGSSIAFDTEKTKFTVFADNTGKWRYRKTFDTEAAAKAWVETKVPVATWYTMDVQAQNPTASNYCDKSGVSAVASGGSFVLTFTGVVPSHLYDNGVDSVASISSKRYTLSNVAANHKLVAIW